MFSRAARTSTLLCCLYALCFGVSKAWAQPGPLVVSGQGFSIRALRNGAPTWSNRTYVWQGVPPEAEEWQFTQLAGGEVASLSVFAPQDSTVTIATAAATTDLRGWQLVKKAALAYTDWRHSAFDVYQRQLRAGETVSIPQGGWTGTLVLAPELQFRDATPKAPAAQPPGVIIARSPKPDSIYIGSPSLVVLPNGDYLASHDFFGRGTTYNRVQIFRSSDKGQTWRHQSEIVGAFWSTLFLHRGALYFMGQSGQDGSVVIRRSLDEGRHWTTPDAEKTGLLTIGKDFSGAPTPVVEHDGRLWRGMEVHTPGRTGANFSAFMMSAPVEANLLDAQNWTISNLVPFPASGPGSTWLEGNAVVTPDGKLVDILRVERDGGETAAIVRISSDGRSATFDAARDFIAFPGGSVKFTIRFDPQTKRYWSIVNPQKNPDALRNRLALVSSLDLRDWRVEQVLLQHPDRRFHAFQYADWQFEGDDILFVSRTAWGGSHSFHDANYLTFHRIVHFRDAAARTLR